MIQKLLILMCMAYSITLTGFKNIENCKQEISQTLLKNNKAAVPTFEEFCKQYDQLVTSFFDTSDLQSLAKHVAKMEDNLVIFNKTSRDVQFASVRPLFVDLNYQLEALIKTLKGYVSSKNTVGLALKVRRFKKLLPYPVNKRSDFSLFWSLHHRLGC